MNESLRNFYEKEITAVGNRLGLEGKFLHEFGFDQMKAAGDELQRLQQENAAMFALLEDVGNEMLSVDCDGSFAAAAGSSSFEHILAGRLNSLIFG